MKNPARLQEPNIKKQRAVIISIMQLLDLPHFNKLIHALNASLKKYVTTMSLSIHF